MLDKLQFLEEKYEDLGYKISDPEVIANMNEWKKLVKEHSSLEPIVNAYKEYKSTMEQIDDTKGMLNEGNMSKDEEDMFKDELSNLTKKQEEIELKIKLMLVPKDPNDDKNVIIEIRGGVGGDEAALFAADLFRMYVRYAERQGWKVDILNSNVTDIGGYKEVVFCIEGTGAYSKLKYESGGHRVQRVPDTEASGRVHTSAATVAVLPEAEEIDDINLDMNDVRIDVFRSSGNGGQSVNTTDSAVRITHAPSGIVISCQDEKSQLKNKDKALKILRSKLLEMEIQKQHSEIAGDRKSQIGSGDRSERVRTYNFPQGRVSDHRIGLTLYKLDSFMDGDIAEMLEALATTDQAEKLKDNM